MKIDFSSNINLYRKNAAAAARPDLPVAETGKTDVMEISRGITHSPDKAFLGIKSAIQRDLSCPADANRLSRLHQEVRDGTYYVSTDQLVNAILSDD